MAYLAGGFIPAPYQTSGTGDAWVAVVAILFFAIVVTVALVVANRPAPVRPAVKETPASVYPKAA